jgi:hypothetical protein
LLTSLGWRHTARYNSQTWRSTVTSSAASTRDQAVGHELQRQLQMGDVQPVEQVYAAREGSRTTHSGYLLLVVALLLVAAWVDADRSLASKFVNWAVDPGKGSICPAICVRGR